MRELYKQELRNLGVDVEEALYRFLDNETLYEGFLSKFLKDTNFFNLKVSLNKDEIKEAIFYAHTLKGVVSNLSFLSLQEEVAVLVDLLRKNKILEAKKIFCICEQEYLTMCSLIMQFTEQG